MLSFSSIRSLGDKHLGENGQNQHAENGHSHYAENGLSQYAENGHSQYTENGHNISHPTPQQPAFAVSKVCLTRSL